MVDVALHSLRGSRIELFIVSMDVYLPSSFSFMVRHADGRRK